MESALPSDSPPAWWDFHDLADRIGDILAEAEASLRLEQAVYGLDSLAEIPLQNLLAAGLAKHFSVERETFYPSAPAKRKSARPRCDLVLTPAGRPLHHSVEIDLFTPTNTCPAADALWLEVKTAAQYHDVATRSSTYTSQWKSAIVDDLRKMSADPAIHHAGLLLIVFNESEEILAKDLQLFEDHLVTTGTLAGFRHVRSIAITERMGHRLASAVLWPTIA